MLSCLRQWGDDEERCNNGHNNKVQFGEILHLNKNFCHRIPFFFLLDATCPQVNLCSVGKTPAYIILHLFQP